MIRRTRQVLVSSALGVALSLSVAAAWAQSQPSQPQSPPANRPNRLGGSIASVSNGAFVLTTRDGRSVTVRTTASTRIITSQPATLADVHNGDTVRILATKAADGSLTARTVQDVPQALQMTKRQHGGVRQGRGDAVMIAGTVTGPPAAGSLMVASSGGQSTSVAVPSTARVWRLTSVPAGALVAGARAMVEGTPNADGSVTASVVFLASRQGK